MRRMIIVAIAMTMTAVAVPAASHYLARPSNDPLGDTLRGYGFVPIRPPSNLMNVGSLYYVDAAVTEFKAICHAEKADVEGAVTMSRSWEMQGEPGTQRAVFHGDKRGLRNAGQWRRRR